MGISNFKIFESVKNMETEINSILYILHDEGFPTRMVFAPNEQTYKITSTYRKNIVDAWKKSGERLEFLDRLQEIGFKYGFVVREKISISEGFNYHIRLKGKIIDKVRASRKIFGKDNNENISKKLPKEFCWSNTNKNKTDQILLIDQEKNFNIFLTNFQRTSKRYDRLYIIVYGDDVFGGDLSKLKCITLCYTESKEGEIVIYDNYGIKIGESQMGGRVDFNELQTQLSLSEKSFKLFNDAWYYIEEDYNNFKYP